MPNDLTKKQEHVFDYIRRRIQEGLPPTTQEVAAEMGISTTTAWQHVKALTAKGRIRVKRYRARGIELVDAAEDVRGRAIPIVGRVPAGVPVLHEENHEGRLWVDNRRVRGRNLFAVEVYGDSMVDAGIFEGDCVVAQPGADVKHGDVVVALVAGEVTIKRLSRNGRKWYLKAENPRYRRIPLSNEDVVQGKVLSVHRTRM